jgi:hypothetical protein
MPEDDPDPWKAAARMILALAGGEEGITMLIWT